MSWGMKLGLIVEGQGDAEAVPILLKKILKEMAPELPLNLLPPYRVKRHQIVQEQVFRTALETLAKRTGRDGRILVLLDADDDAPCQLGPRLQGWARLHHADMKVEVALAQRTYEAWFIASAVSLRGKCGLPKDLLAPLDPDAVPSPKGWVHDRLKTQSRSYKETTDQAQLTQDMSVREARRSKSFNKLLVKLGRLFDVPVPPLERP